jgi:hypothetical protein
MPTHSGSGSGPGPLHHEPGSNEPEVTRLLEALTAARTTVRRSTEDLQDAACAYVRHLKRGGLRAEQVIVRLKTAIDTAGLRNRSLERDALIETTITHCIREYYRD